MVLNKYIELLTSPTTFFRKMDRVKTYFDPWLFFVIFGLFEIVIQLPLVIIDYANAATEDALIQLVVTVVSFGMLPLTPFIAAGIAHLGMMILGHDGYYKTYKPLTYALTVSVPYSIGIILLSSIIAAVASQNVNSPEGLFELILSVPIFIIAIASFVHFVYAACVGAAHTHRVTKLRAFLGMYVIPTAIFTALGAILLFLFFVVILGIAAVA